LIRSAAGEAVSEACHCLERRWLADSPPQPTQHRDINIRGIGYVASEITKNHGIAICAPVAPYDVTRKEVRAVIEPLEEPTQAIMLHMEREGLSGLTTICNPLNISRTHLAKKTAILTSDSGSERLDPLRRWPTLRRCDRAIDRPHRSQTVADEVKKS